MYAVGCINARGQRFASAGISAHTIPFEFYLTVALIDSYNMQCVELYVIIIVIMFTRTLYLAKLHKGLYVFSFCA